MPKLIRTQVLLIPREWVGGWVGRGAGRGGGQPTEAGCGGKELGELKTFVTVLS